MTKLADAIAKVQKEMSSNANNSYVQAVGGLLLQHLNENPDSAEYVLTEGRSIVKSLDAMRKEAEKKKVGNCAVLTDAEGFAIVLNYFRSAEPETKAPAPAKTEKKSEKKPPKEKPSEKKVEMEDDDLDFDALLA